MVAGGEQDWRLDKAERFFAAAERALESEDWETAVSRAYYALYHAAIAVLESRGEIRRRRWDHVQVQIEFRSRFARRGFLFTSRDADVLEEMQEARLQADYENTFPRRADARRLVQAARILVRRIEEAIENA